MESSSCHEIVIDSVSRSHIAEMLKVARLTLEVAAVLRGTFHVESDLDSLKRSEYKGEKRVTM